MRLDWDKVEELEKQKGDEVRKKVIKILKQLDSKLKKQNKMERIGLCIVEYKELGNKDKLDYERVVLKWDKERGYFFEGHKFKKADKKTAYEWDAVDDLMLIDFNKYKNLRIEDITSDIAIKIGKELLKVIKEIENEIMKDVRKKETILKHLNIIEKELV